MRCGAFVGFVFFLLLSGCDPHPKSSKESDTSPRIHEAASSRLGESEIATLCELEVAKHMHSPDSFEADGLWQLTWIGSVAKVRRDYSVSNLYGVEISSFYHCKYDVEAEEIVALKIGSVGREHVIVEDSHAAERAEELRQIGEGAARALEKNDPPAASKTPIRWIVNLEMTGCPKASDWFGVQEAVKRGRWDVELPSRCFKIPAGSAVFAPTAGNRETTEHQGHSYEKGALENGVEFWTDEMDDLSVEPRR